MSIITTFSRGVPFPKGAAFLLVAIWFIGCAGTSENSGPVSEKEPVASKEFTGPGLEEEWGIKVESLRLSAGGYMLDFRYRVIDPDKAMPLFDHKVEPHLVDQETGVKSRVPSSPKVGSMRQKVRGGKPIADRIYFILFGNPEGNVKPGSKVTVAIGDFEAKDLIVQ